MCILPLPNTMFLRLLPYSRTASHHLAKHTRCKEVRKTQASFREQSRCSPFCTSASLFVADLFLEAIFQQASSLPYDDVSVTVSYMEIYKDECYDLLVSRENVRQHLMLLHFRCLLVHRLLNYLSEKMTAAKSLLQT